MPVAAFQPQLVEWDYVYHVEEDDVYRGFSDAAGFVIRLQHGSWFR